MLRIFASAQPAVSVSPTWQTHILDQLTLRDGSVLAPVTLAYETWGTLAPTGDNVVLLCHALTGSSHAYDPAAPDDPRAGWWNPLIGPGCVFDTDRYFLVCSNVLGSCYGSTGSGPRLQRVSRASRARSGAHVSRRRTARYPQRRTRLTTPR
jgi:homoserine acetyltransferase